MQGINLEPMAEPPKAAVIKALEVIPPSALFTILEPYQRKAVFALAVQANKNIDEEKSNQKA